jgi:hypothetical protein
VALREAVQVGSGNVLDVSLVHFAIRNLARFHQFAQPRGRERIVLVVVDAHAINRYSLTLYFRPVELRMVRWRFSTVRPCRVRRSLTRERHA